MRKDQINNSTIDDKRELQRKKSGDATGAKHSTMERTTNDTNDIHERQKIRSTIRRSMTNDNFNQKKGGDATRAKNSTVTTIRQWRTNDKRVRAAMLPSRQERNLGNSMYTGPVICGGWSRSVGNPPHGSLPA